MPPSRSAAGHRQYTPEDVTRIQFIKRAQELGFSLDEVEELLALRIESESACDEVREQAERKIVEISGKVADLLAMKKNTLAQLVDECKARKPSQDCPIRRTLGTSQERQD